MDPTRPLTTPIAEVRAQAPVQVDEFGEAWVVIDGIETKVPSIQHARRILEHQDTVRAVLRADMDAIGLRFNPDGTDREEQVEITLEDGTKTTVGLMKPGVEGANYMQIGNFPDAEGLFAAAEHKQRQVDAEERFKQLAEEAHSESQTMKIAKRVMKRFKKALARLARK